MDLLSTRWALAALLLGSAAAAGAEEPPLGLLPTAGDPALVRELDRTLAEEAAKRTSRSVLPPIKVQARLWRAPGVAGATQDARSSVLRAEQKLLNMDRAGAVAEARRAIGLLVPVGGRFHTPRLISRAHVTLARALLLKPPDPEAARSSLRAALDATPDLSAEGLPPRASRLLRHVREEPARSNPPTIGELASLCKQSGASGLVWISARTRGEAVDLEILIYDRATQMNGRRLRERVPAGRLVLRAAELIAGVAGPPPGVAVHAPSPGRKKPDVAPAPTPWYRRWWIWAIAGAVVAGTTASVIVATRNGSQGEGFSIRLQFE